MNKEYKRVLKTLDTEIKDVRGKIKDREKEYNKAYVEKDEELSFFLGGDLSDLRNELTHLINSKRHFEALLAKKH